MSYQNRDLKESCLFMIIRMSLNFQISLVREASNEYKAERFVVFDYQYKAWCQASVPAFIPSDKLRKILAPPSLPGKRIAIIIDGGCTATPRWHWELLQAQTST